MAKPVPITGSFSNPQPSTSSIAFVNAASAGSLNANASSVAVTLSVSIGNEIVVVIASSVAVSTVTDSAGTTYTQLIAQVGSLVTIYHGTAAATSASDTITVTVGSSTGLAISVAQYSGVKTTGNTATATGTGTNPNVSVTTQDTNNWAVAGIAMSGGTVQHVFSMQYGTLQAQSSAGVSGTTQITGAEVDSGGPAAASGTTITLGVNST